MTCRCCLCAQDITIVFADVDLFGSVTVYDIWAQVGVFRAPRTGVWGVDRVGLGLRVSAWGSTRVA